MNHKNLTKKQAIKLAGSAANLARILGIKPSAICQWGVYIPPKRTWQLIILRPEWFSCKD